MEKASRKQWLVFLLPQEVWLSNLLSIWRTLMRCLDFAPLPPEEQNVHERRDGERTTNDVRALCTSGVTARTNMPRFIIPCRMHSPIALSPPNYDSEDIQRISQPSSKIGAAVVSIGPNTLEILAGTSSTTDLGSSADGPAKGFKIVLNGSLKKRTVLRNRPKSQDWRDPWRRLSA